MMNFWAGCLLPCPTVRGEIVEGNSGRERGEASENPRYSAAVRVGFRSNRLGTGFKDASGAKRPLCRCPLSGRIWPIALGRPSSDDARQFYEFAAEVYRKAWELVAGGLPEESPG